MAEQTFKCQSCDLVLVYRRMVLPNLRGVRRKDKAPGDTASKVVYLTCDHGHTHSYTVDA